MLKFIEILKRMAKRWLRYGGCTLSSFDVCGRIAKPLRERAFERTGP